VMASASPSPRGSLFGKTEHSRTHHRLGSRTVKQWRPGWSIVTQSPTMIDAGRMRRRRPRWHRFDHRGASSKWPDARTPGPWARRSGCASACS